MERNYVQIDAEWSNRIDEVIRKGPYSANWNSLAEAEVPNWFLKEKFGIFIHWGIYSVPANSNEWYSRNMYIQKTEAFEHHISTYGEHNKFGYKDFIPMFKAEKFEPKKWAELFKEAGAKYVFPVAEHHDGFQMYDSELSDWNAVNMGPQRDILGELKQALEEKELTFCTSTHRAEHWFFMSHGKEFDSDIKEPMQRGDFYWPAMPEPAPEDLYSKPYPSKEYLTDWMIRTCEIIDKYQPALLYFDWWIQHQAFRPYLLKIAAYYYNRGVEWGKKVMICYKHDAMSFGTGIVEVERGGFSDAKPYPWQTDTAVARNSWCYTDTLDYKSPQEIIYTLIDVVSKNGNLLLNIGPKADGTIPSGDEHILRELGSWLKINGEAIYSSKVWRSSKEGPTIHKEGQFQDAVEMKFTAEDFRFTAKGDSIYVFAMNYPEDQKICVKSLGCSEDQNMPRFHGIIRDVTVLGSDEHPCWEQEKEGLYITTEDINSKYPVVFKIKVE